MNVLKTTNPQITRWFDLLQDFKLEVKHQPEISMSHVDMYICMPAEGNSDTMNKLINNRLEVLVAVTEEYV